MKRVRLMPQYASGLASSKAGMKIEEEEGFSPVLAVNPFNDFTDAVRRANATRYGLQGGMLEGVWRGTRRNRLRDG